MKDPIRYVRQSLIAAGIPDADREAKDLVIHVLQINRATLIYSPEILVSDVQKLQLEACLERRINGEPVDRIVGFREFLGYQFYLNADTLSPREDSECVIDLALQLKNNAQSLLDLGTGTGCLLLTLLIEMPQANGIGVDVSQNAVEMAQYNAQTLGLKERATFITSNWFEKISQKFDLILSNPPYIETAIIVTLEKEVRDFDPILALDGGGDGLNCYHIIAKGAGKALNNGGTIIVEIGFNQKKAVIAIFKSYGFLFIQSRKDGGEIIRALAFAKP